MSGAVHVRLFVPNEILMSLACLHVPDPSVVEPRYLKFVQPFIISALSLILFVCHPTNIYSVLAKLIHGSYISYSSLRFLSMYNRIIVNLSKDNLVISRE